MLTNFNSKIFFIKVIILILISFSFYFCGKKIQFSSYLKSDYKWSMYGQYPSRQFYINDTISLPLKIDLTTNLKAGLNYSSVTFMDEFLFVGDLKGNIYKLDLNSGRINNYNSFKQPILTSVVVQENNLIFPVAANRDKKSYLIIYNLIKGEETSRFAVEGSIEKEILLVGNDIIVTSTSGAIYKLKKDYTLEWSINLKSQIYSHPAAGNEFFVTASTDGTVFLISFDGKILKQIKVNNPIKSGFSIEDSKIYFGDEVGFLYCYDYDQENFVFFKKLDASINAIPSIDNENIYVGDLKGNVFSIKKVTGEINWKRPLSGLINNAILIVGDKLVVPNFQKKIYILDKKSGNVLQELEFEGRIKLSPIYIKKKLIVGCDDKKIIFLSN